MTQKVALLIDADLICYRCAAKAEKRSIQVTHIKSGNQKEFKTRTEFKKFLTDKGFEYKEELYKIDDIQTAEHIRNALSSVKNLFAKLKTFTGASVVESYVGGGENFRHKLALPSPYKNNRGDLIKPVHLEEVRDYAIAYLGTEDHYGKDYEVDDWVSIRAYFYLRNGYKPIIVSSDKDSFQAQGCSVLNWTEEEWKIVDIPSVGELYKDKSAIKGTGLMFLAFQAIWGDRSDTYIPYELSSVKYGATQAYKALAECTSEKEIIEALIKEYKKLYPEPVEYLSVHGDPCVADWKDLLSIYWKAAYMRRSEYDPSDVKQFFKRYGVNLEDY